MADLNTARPQIKILLASFVSLCVLPNVIVDPIYCLINFKTLISDSKGSFVPKKV